MAEFNFTPEDHEESLAHISTLFPDSRRAPEMPAGLADDDPSVLGDIIASPFRGVAGLVEGIGELPNIIPGIDYDIPDNLGLGKSKTLWGSVPETLTTFLIPFGGAVKGVSYAGKAARTGKLGKTTQKAEKLLKAGSKTREIAKFGVAGAATDFAVWDGHEARLSDLIEDVPGLSNPVTAFLASDPDDSEAAGRLKNAVEGLGLGVGLDILLMPVLRYLQKSRTLRAEGASPERVAKETESELEAINEAYRHPEVEKSLEKLSEAEKVRLEVPTEVGAERAKEAAALLRGRPGEEGGMDQFLRDVEEGDSEEVLKSLDTRFGKDGVLLNINALSNGEEVAQSTVHLVDQLYNSIRAIKTTFRLRPEMREAMRLELKKMGLDESAAIFQGIKEEYEFDSKLVAAHITLRNTTNQFEQNVQNIQTLQRRLAKATSEAERTEITNQLNIGRLHFFQHSDQIRIMVAAMGEARSQGGRRLRMFGLLDKADEATAELIKNALDNKLDISKLSTEELDKLIAKAAAVTEKHGAAGVAELSAKGFIELHNEIWINALLSGPRTFAVNAIGNALTSIYLPFEKAMGAQIRMWGAKSPIEREKYRLMRKELLNFGFYISNLSEAFTLGRKAFTKEDSVIAPRAAVTSELKGPAITSEHLPGIANYFGTGVDKAGRVIRLPIRLLTGTDEFFKQLQFRQTAKTDSAMKAYDDLVAEYGDDLTSEILEKELPARTASYFDGLIREGGERYSQGQLRKDAYKDMLRAMAASGEEWDAVTRQQFMRDHYTRNFNQSKMDISDRAFSAAHESTFTSPQTGTLGKLVQKAVNEMPVLRLILPFVSTPLNIIKFAGQRTLPFDLPVLRKWHAKREADLAAGDDLTKAALMGRQAVGTALWAGGVTAVASGKITGRGPTDPNERKILQETGWQPYSLKFGDTYMSYQRLDPFATFLGAVADITEYASEKRGERLDDPEWEELLGIASGAALAGLSQNAINKSYMTGLKQILDAVSDPDARMEKFIHTRAGSYVPSFFGQMAGSLDGDDAIRESRTVLEALEKRFPGAGLDPRRNVLGEVVKRPKTGIGLIDYVSPITFSSKKNDPVFNEIAKSSAAFQLPRKTNLGVDYTRFKNKKGQTAYDRWQELQGTTKLGRRTLRQELQRLIRSTRFQRLSDVPTDELGSPRAREISRVIRRYRAKAQKEMFKEFPGLKKQLSLHQSIKFNEERGRDTSALNSELDQLLTQLRGY